MKLSKLVFVALALLAQVAHATPAVAPDILKYEIVFKSGDDSSPAKILGNDTFVLSAVLGKETAMASITETAAITEINSNHGTTTLAAGVLKTGVEASVTPEAVTSTGQYTTTIKYTLWDRGLAVAKGTHVLDLKKGVQTELVSFPNRKVYVTLLDNELPRHGQ